MPRIRLTPPVAAFGRAHPLVPKNVTRPGGDTPVPGKTDRELSRQELVWMCACNSMI